MVKLQNRRAGNIVAQPMCCGAAFGGQMTVANSFSCGAVAREFGAVVLPTGGFPKAQLRISGRRVCKRASVALQMRPAVQPCAPADGFAAR